MILRRGRRVIDLTLEEIFETLHQVGGWSAYGNDTTLRPWGWGGSVISAASPIAAVAVKDADGSSIKLNTSAVISTNATVTPQANNDFLREMDVVGKGKFKLNQLTDVRYFCGISSSISATIQSDTPSAHYAGLHFSTTRDGGDTTWMLQSGDGTATPEITDTGVMADLTAHTPIVLLDDSEPAVRIILLDRLGLSLVDVIHKTRVPAAATAMRYVKGAKTLVAAAKTFQTYYAKWGMPR